MRKAYTARTFRSPSGALVERLKADPTLGLIHLTNVISRTALRRRQPTAWPDRDAAVRHRFTSS